jgi:hypothetical protein
MQHVLELLYENENDDGKEKLNEIEPVMSIYEDPGDEVKFSEVPKMKKKSKKSKRQCERCSSNDSTHTI